MVGCGASTFHGVLKLLPRRAGIDSNYKVVQAVFNVVSRSSMWVLLSWSVVCAWAGLGRCRLVLMSVL